MTFTPFNSRLELLWTFDDDHTDSGTTKDKSGNTNTGTISGGVTTGVNGVKGTEAFDFNGTDGEVEADHSSSLNITNQLTISAWVNLDELPSSTGTPMDIASKGDRGSANANYQITVETSDNARFQITDSNENNHNTTSSTTLTTDRWYHITGRFTGTEIEIFVDAEQENSESHDVTLLDDTTPFYAGRNYYGGGPEWLDGQIDDVRVYSSALSDDQIYTLYTFRRKDLQRGLVSHWTMNSSDTDGSTAYDKTPHNNHATLSGDIQQTSAPIGDGLQFDGNDDLFVFDEITMDRFSATISFWISPDSASTEYTFVSHTSGFNEMIELEPGGTFCETNSNGNMFNTADYSLRSEWHHITVVFENERAYWYEDGQLLGEATNYNIDNYNDENEVDKMVADTTLDRIGDTVYDNKYAGGVSDLRFYDRALSDEEINAIYNQRTQQSQTSAPYKVRPRAGNPPNLMDATQWELYTEDNQGDFNANGETGENNIIRGTGPYGDIVPLWYGRSENTDDAGDGGWNWHKLSTGDIDRSQRYRYTVWMKQEYPSGSYYHGTENVQGRGGNFNSNPYYGSGDLPTMEDWYLVVGYNHPVDSDKNENMSAIYDTDGNKVRELTDYWWASDSNFGDQNMRWRSYYYYDTNEDRGTFFYDPRLEVCDGTETPLADLLQPATDFSNGRDRVFFDGFDGGNLNGWDVNSGSIVSDRTRKGPYAVHCTNSNSSYLFRTDVNGGGGEQVSKVEYWFQETSGGSTGAGLRLKNSDSNYELGVATDNPQWDIEDGNGFETDVHPSLPNYETWTRFTMTFDWDAGTFGVDFEQPSTGITYTDSGRPLMNGVDVEYVEAWDYYNEWGGTSVNQWYDSFEVRY